MTDITLEAAHAPRNDNWLKRYYFMRAGFALAWVVAALAIGRVNTVFAMLLLLIYPAWDALANVLDAQRDGGLKRNGTQALNVVVSGITTLAVVAMLQVSMHAVLGTFGVWAALSGLLQLATGVRRWKNHGAQWAMILSGAQSTLAGIFFLKQANGAAAVDITAIVPYAAFGAFYFLVAAVGLVVSGARRRQARPR